MQVSTWCTHTHKHHTIQLLPSSEFECKSKFSMKSITASHKTDVCTYKIKTVSLQLCQESLGAKPYNFLSAPPSKRTQNRAKHTEKKFVFSLSTFYN